MGNHILNISQKQHTSSYGEQLWRGSRSVSIATHASLNQSCSSSETSSKCSINVSLSVCAVNGPRRNSGRLLPAVTAKSSLK
jgi:hypothetical protein